MAQKSHQAPWGGEVDYYLAQLLADHCVLGSANCSLEVPRDVVMLLEVEATPERWKKPMGARGCCWVNYVERDWMKGNTI